MENQIFELQYAMDTFYFLVCGALVMWMAAGFAMLEAGLVRSKNTTEILTKNIALYAVACTMYMVCGYSIMYGGDEFSMFLKGIVSDGVAGAEEPATYAPSADFFFQVRKSCDFFDERRYAAYHHLITVAQELSPKSSKVIDRDGLAKVFPPQPQALEEFWEALVQEL